MKVRTMGLLFKEGVVGLWRNRGMSVASISSVAAVLLVLGLFLILILNVNSIVASVESSVEIKVFLLEGLTTSDINSIGAKIEGISGVKEIIFESKEEALKKYKKQLGDKGELLEGLEGENNPFPNSYIVKVEEPGLIGVVAQEIGSLEGVEEVRYGKDIVDKLLKITNFIRAMGMALVLVLSFISVFIISNTIKLAVASRRKEISIMKYVGATDTFIRLPFIIEGFLFGILGAVLSSGILALVYNYFINLMNRNFGSLYVLISGSLTPFHHTMYQVSLLLLVAGGLIGIAGSRISLRKFLKV